MSALNANGAVVSGYTGTVHFTSSDALAILPANYTFTSANDGSHTFTVTLKTAGNETITATDTMNSSITGSTSVTVSAAAANKLVFCQQPANATAGSVLTPAVTVEVLDQYGNLVTSDHTDRVTLAFGSNPGSATLGGTTTVTVSGGVATFSSLTVSAAGNGYTLKASSGSLTATTSTSFNVAARASTTARLIESFETSEMYNVVGGPLTGSLSTVAAHDGNFGLDLANGNDWIYRDDSAAQVKAGDTLSVWLQFSGSADGRAYFGFGSTASGTLSLVAAPNTGQLILQDNAGYSNYVNLAAVNQTFAANHWYRLEVDWSTTGTIVGKLFDSNGTTLLQSVTASTTAITSGGIAFRATGSDKYFDTVTDTPGVNTNAVPAALSVESLTNQTLLGIPLSFGIGRPSAFEVSMAVFQATGTSGEFSFSSLPTGDADPVASSQASVQKESSQAILDSVFASFQTTNESGQRPAGQTALMLIGGSDGTGSEQTSEETI